MILHDSHVERWIYINRASLFKIAKEFGDEVRKYFPNAYVEYAEENGRVYDRDSKKV